MALFARLVSYQEHWYNIFRISKLSKQVWKYEMATTAKKSIQI